MIIEKNTEVKDGFFSGDPAPQKELGTIRMLAAGWYLEWELNDKFLLAIKSTS